MKKSYTFRAFKKFLDESCFDIDKYKKGLYDRAIYNWFDLGKPRRIEFFTKDGKFKKSKF